MNTVAAFIRNRRGAAALECALGLVAMVSAWTLLFDLYQRADSQGVLLHTAAAFADYASRDDKVKAESLADLAAFLHAQQFPTAKASFVATAITKAAAKTQPNALWTKTIAINPDPTDTTPLPACSRVNGKNSVVLPSVFTMSNGETIIVAEVCTGADDNATYAHYIVPTRSETSPTLEEEDDDSA